jgi:hypothetical protein
MSARSLISVAVVAISAIVGAAANSQTPTDPARKTHETESGGQPMAVPPSLPGVPPLLPSIYSQHPPPGLPHVAGATTSPGQFAPARNPGPVTGYGPGGMAPIPGAPPNPPYSYGPLR